MSKEFEIAREFEVDATPQQVWDAFTAGTGGWLWPMEEPEPREGGKGPFGSTVTVWDPPHRYTNRVENVDGISEQTLNQLDYTVEPRDEGRMRVGALCAQRHLRRRLGQPVRRGGPATPTSTCTPCAST